MSQFLHVCTFFEQFVAESSSFESSSNMVQDDSSSHLLIAPFLLLQLFPLFYDQRSEDEERDLLRNISSNISYFLFHLPFIYFFQLFIRAISIQKIWHFASFFLEVKTPIQAEPTRMLCARAINICTVSILTWHFASFVSWTLEITGHVMCVCIYFLHLIYISLFCFWHGLRNLIYYYWKSNFC